MFCFIDILNSDASICFDIKSCISLKPYFSIRATFCSWRMLSWVNLLSKALIFIIVAISNFMAVAVAEATARDATNLAATIVLTRASLRC